MTNPTGVPPTDTQQRDPECVAFGRAFRRSRVVDSDGVRSELPRDDRDDDLLFRAAFYPEYVGDISTCQACGQYWDALIFTSCPGCGGYLG
jgi:hypothetical protein